MRLAAIAALTLGVALAGEAQLVAKITPELEKEAIAEGGASHVEPFVAGYYPFDYTDHWLIGVSTPYSRIRMAAAHAAKRMKPFSWEDLKAERAAILAPEIEVRLEIHAPKKVSDKRPAIERVVIAKRGSTSLADVIQPLKEAPVLEEYTTAMGAKVQTRGAVARFPLSAASAENDVVVIQTNGEREAIPFKEKFVASMK